MVTITHQNAPGIDVSGDRRQLRVSLPRLGVVRRRAEDDHRDDEEEEEHAQFVQTGLDRHAEDPQTLRRKQRTTERFCGFRVKSSAIVQSSVLPRNDFTYF